MSEGWDAPTGGGNGSFQESVSEHSFDASIRRSSLCSLFSIASDGCGGIESGVSVDTSGVGTRGDLGFTEDDSLLTYGKLVNSGDVPGVFPRAVSSGGCWEVESKKMAQSKAAFLEVFPIDTPEGAVPLQSVPSLCPIETLQEKQGRCVSQCGSQSDMFLRVASRQVLYDAEEESGGSAVMPHGLCLSNSVLGAGAYGDSAFRESLPSVKEPPGSSLCHFNRSDKEGPGSGETSEVAVCRREDLEPVFHSGEVEKYEEEALFADPLTGACCFHQGESHLSGQPSFLRIEEEKTTRSENQESLDKDLGFRHEFSYPVAATEVPFFCNNSTPSGQALCLEPFDRLKRQGEGDTHGSADALVGSVSESDRREQWNPTNSFTRDEQFMRHSSHFLANGPTCQCCGVGTTDFEGSLQNSGRKELATAWSCLLSSGDGNSPSEAPLEKQQETGPVALQPEHASSFPSSRHSSVQTGERTLQFMEMLCDARVAESTESSFCDDMLRPEQKLTASKLRHRPEGTHSLGQRGGNNSIFPFSSLAETPPEMNAATDCFFQGDKSSSVGVHASVGELLPMVMMMADAVSPMGASPRFQLGISEDQGEEEGRGETDEICLRFEWSPQRRLRREGRRRRRQSDLWFSQRTGNAEAPPSLANNGAGQIQGLCPQEDPQHVGPNALPSVCSSSSCSANEFSSSCCWDSGGDRFDQSDFTSDSIFLPSQQQQRNLLASTQIYDLPSAVVDPRRAPEFGDSLSTPGNCWNRRTEGFGNTDRSDGFRGRSMIARRDGSCLSFGNLQDFWMPTSVSHYGRGGRGGLSSDLSATAGRTVMETSLGEMRLDCCPATPGLSSFCAKNTSTQTRFADPPNRHRARSTLIVTVPPMTTRSDLHDAFSQFGVVEQETVVCGEEHRHPNREWTATKGYAFVRFQTSEMAAAAVDASARGALCLRNSRVRAAWAKKDSEPKGAGAGSRKSSLDSFNAEFWGSSSFWGNQS